MTKMFLDCEFTGLQKHAELISIGLISEDGRTFYAESADLQTDKLDTWIKENVLPGLRFKSEYSSRPTIDPEHHAMKSWPVQIREDLAEWLAQFEQVEMWGDCLAYDWVLFCDLFGGAQDIPKNVYYIPFDICTLMKVRGVDPDISREEFVSDFQAGGALMKHNALHDAVIIRRCYNKLEIMARAMEG